MRSCSRSFCRELLQVPCLHFLVDGAGTLQGLGHIVTDVLPADVVLEFGTLQQSLRLFRRPAQDQSTT